jgi:hypothetical protein
MQVCGVVRGGVEPLTFRLQVGPLQAARAAPAGIALPALRSYGIPVAKMRR